MSTRLLGCFLVDVMTGLAQSPVINDGGVVNAASYANLAGPGHALGRGSIASISGKDLSSSAALAGSYPLPTKLNGTAVTVGGLPAPLFYVAKDQINFQVPALC